MNSVFIRNYQCPGDICMLTCAVRDLKNTLPKLRINVGTSASYLWDNNPYLDRSITEQNADKVIDANYPLINRSNTHNYHFVHGFRLDLAKKLQIPIAAGPHEVDIHLSTLEKTLIRADLPERYWIINAGHKQDFTAKMWEFSRYAEVVERLKDRVTFVQIGLTEHTHNIIPGAINLVGKTDGRKLIPLMYRASGVLTGVSFPMHLSTMQTPEGYTCGRRPCVCLVGGREPITWVQQANMQALHFCSMLDCCPLGGCWKSRITPLNDGSEQDKSICTKPVQCASGQIIPKCMDMISVDDVVRVITQIEDAYNMCNCKKNKPVLVKATPKKIETVSDLVERYPAKEGGEATATPIPARRTDETRAAYLKRLKQSDNSVVKASVSAIEVKEVSAQEAATEIALEQCYLCAKKHVGRAQIFFEEYHTGYSDRDKRLIESLQITEDTVKAAFLLKEKVQAHLDMGSGELVGHSTDGGVVDDMHIQVANAIRNERLKLQDNPMYVPNFEGMLVSIQQLQYSE